MANPTPYAREFSFTSSQASNAYAPPPGLKVDAELDQIAAAISGVIAALETIRRPDGTLDLTAIPPELMAPFSAAAVLAFFNTLPTTQPTTVGAWWNNGGVVSQVQS